MRRVAAWTSRHRFSGLLSLGLVLGLGLPSMSQAALVRYTYTATLDTGATLGAADVSQGLFKAWADVEAASASPTFSSTSPLRFSIVKDSSTYQGVLTNFSGIQSNSGTPLVQFNNSVNLQALGVTGTGSYFDLTATTAYSVTNTAILGSPMVTSIGTLTLSNGFVGGTGTMSRAAVPEPGQVALGVLAAGYALISAGRRRWARSTAQC